MMTGAKGDRLDRMIGAVMKMKKFDLETLKQAAAA
jgi:hypothetical protein